MHTGKARRHFVNRHHCDAIPVPTVARSLHLIQTRRFRRCSFLQQNCLDRAGGSLRSVAKRLHKKDKAGWNLPVGNANVCTSRAMEPGFFAHKAQRSPSMLARSVDASSRQCCRSSSGRSPGNVRPGAARSGRELLAHRSVHAARRARRSRSFLIQSNRSQLHPASAEQ